MFSFQAFKIVQHADKTIIIIRFIGTSALSSSITDVFMSIIFQLKTLFQLEIPEYDAKKVASVRKALEACLDNIYQQDSKQKIIIFLDSIDQLSKIDSSLDWLLTKIPYSVKIFYSTISDYSDILTKLQAKIIEKNFMEIQSMNFENAKYIIDFWLDKSVEKHQLTDEQTEIIKVLFNKSPIYPLYIKIIFDIIFKWTSYEIIDKAFLNLDSIDSCIKYIFENCEKIHGKLVFSRCMFYFTIFNNGISENELEDILSIDDDVLSDVFQHHEPTVRRFPGGLWQRIKFDLKDYIFESKSDEIKVIHWYHRKFRELASKIYIDCLNEMQKYLLIKNIIDYFNETWSRTPKPFEYTEKIRKKRGLQSTKAEAIRKTKPQNLQLELKNGDIVYNNRKLIQLPFFLFQISNETLKLNAIKTFIFSDLEFLQSLFSTNSFLFNERSNEIWNLYDQFKTTMNTIVLFNSIFEKNIKLFHKFPNTVAYQLSTRFASVKSNENDDINKYVEDYETKTLNNKQPLLCPLYSFMPIGENDGLKSVLFTNDAIKCLISSNTVPILITFSENMIYLLDSNNYTALNNIQVDETIESVYIHSSSNKLMDTGGIIGHSKNEIYSFNMNGTLIYKRSLNNIKFFRLLSSKHACLILENSKYLEIMSISNGDAILKTSFNFQISHFVINVDQYKIVLAQDLQIVYLVVCLENGEIKVLQFNIETENFFEISSIPSTGLKLLTCMVDRSFYVNSQKENLLRFACYFEAHCCLFNIIRTTRKDQPADYTITDIKFNDPYLASELTSSMVDFHQNLILFVFNSCIHAYLIGKKEFF